MKVPHDYLVMAAMLGCVVGFGWDAARCAPSSPEPDDTPAYARLYDQLLALEEAGKPLDAIRLVPAILGDDIPVQAFYSTLDAKRQQLLGAILRRGDVTIAGKQYSVSELKQGFLFVYLGQPDVCRSRVAGDGTLPLERFLYTLVVAGQPPPPAGAGALVEAFLPDVDLKKAIKSNDAWIVSTALFMARKQGSTIIDPGDVIARWAARRDLWDDDCTQQALLFLAKQDPDVISAMKVENEDVAEALKALEPPLPDSCEIRPLFFSLADGRPIKDAGPKTSLVSLRPDDSGTTVRTGAPGASDFRQFKILSKREISESELREGSLMAAPGFYQIEHLSEHADGKSTTIELRPGTSVRLPVLLNPHI